MTTTPHWPQPPPTRRVGVGDLTTTLTGNFYADAKNKLGGQVSAIEDQALAAMNGWGDDAKNAVMNNLDPNLVALTQTAIQGVTSIQGGVGLNPNTFTAVAGLVAGALGGGPVAAAAVGSLVTSLFVMGEAITAVFKLFGLNATSGTLDPNFVSYFGWPKKSQIIPGGPNDHGDGTYQNPGWQSVLDQVNAMGAGGYIHCPPNDISYSDVGGFQSKLPSYLNGQAAVGSTSDLQPWCEMQAAPKDDFRQFFYQLFYQNLDYVYNASPIAPVDLQQLLMHAAKIWNASHDPGTPQTYKAEVPQNGKFTSTIAAIMAGEMPWSGPQQPGMPDIVIFTGPLVSQVTIPAGPQQIVTLRIPPNGGAITASAPTSTTGMSTGGKILAGTAAIGGAALLGSAAYAFAKKESIGTVWKNVFKTVTKPLRGGR